MIRTLIAILLISLCIGANGQNAPSLGAPFVQNFTKSEYRAGNQNWGIAQSKEGVIYAANGYGLIRFDGAYWELYPIHNKSAVRSVSIADNGWIHVGGKEEFGYFENKNGKLSYCRLSSLVDPALLKNDEIWKILFVDDKVLFQSFSKCYIYHHNKIDIIYGSGEPFLFAHKVNHKIYIEKIPSGLQIWEENGFKPLQSSLSNVHTALSFDDEQVLLGTSKNGLFLLQANGQIIKWKLDPALDWLLVEAQINNGIKINDHTFAFGTIKNGIFIIDKQGQLVQHIHKRNGLQNNTVLSLTLDKQGNIWAGLDNGIDRIEINSPFYYYKDIFGELGTVYAIKVYKGNIYLGTNQGLFYSKWPNTGNNSLHFKFIPNSQGQVWSLDIFNQQLICGHNEGTFLIEGESFQRLSPLTGGWMNLMAYQKDNIFLQGNYTGLAVFGYNNGWKLNKQLDYPKEAVRNLHHKEGNTYWIVLNNEMQLVEFTENYESLSLLKSFSFLEDFPDIHRIYPVQLQNNSLFATDKGLFVYDNMLEKFKPYDELNKTLGNFRHANKIIPLPNSAYMFVNQGRFAAVKFGNDLISIDSLQFNILEDKVMKNYEVVEAFEDNYLFGLDHGFAIFNHAQKNLSKISAPIIKGLQDINAVVDSLLFLDSTHKIPNHQNNIRILFSSPWYSSSPIKYQYILEGYQNEWSNPTTVPYIDFTNLSFGKHTFKVRALSADGQVSDSTQLTFRISPPWYLQWPALILYMLIAVSIFLLARKLTINKIIKDKMLLRQKLQKRQEELLRREAEQNERKLMELRNQQLIQELELKNRELANAATNIVYKNELLNNLHEELLNLKDNEGRKLSLDQLQKVNKLIDNARSDERDWDVFEKSFNESHENFFKKLKSDFPSLSPNDLKLCAYLRLNMSSKDIASILNITTRGVEIRRYRLRKKFDLPTEKNLTEFLLER